MNIYIIYNSHNYIKNLINNYTTIIKKKRPKLPTYYIPSVNTDGFNSVGNSVTNLPTYFKNSSIITSDEHFTDRIESVDNEKIRR